MHTSFFKVHSGQASSAMRSALTLLVLSTEFFFVTSSILVGGDFYHPFFHVLLLGHAATFLPSYLTTCVTSHLTHSHLTRQASHDTPHASHTSHLTSHASHLTRHASHVKPHTTHLKLHTSRLTSHASHLTRHGHVHTPSKVACFILCSVCTRCSVCTVPILHDAQSARC